MDCWIFGFGLRITFYASRLSHPFLVALIFRSGRIAPIRLKPKARGVAPDEVDSGFHFVSMRNVEQVQPSAGQILFAHFTRNAQCVQRVLHGFGLAAVVSSPDDAVFPVQIFFFVVDHGEKIQKNAGEQVGRALQVQHVAGDGNYVAKPGNGVARGGETAD